MPRQTSSPKSRKSLRQKSLLNFFQQDSSQLVIGGGGSRSSSGEGSKLSESNATPARRGRTRSAPKKRASKNNHDLNSSIFGSSDSENPVNEDGSESSDVGAIGFQEASDAEDLEDSVVLSPKRPTASPRKVRRLRADSVERTVATEDSDGEPEVVGVPVIRKKKDSVSRVKSRKEILAVESDEDEPQPKRRKLLKGVRPPTPEEDLLDEVDSDKIITTRLRSRDKKSVFLRNLDKYKKKKQKQIETEPEDESGESVDEEDVAAPFAGAKPHTGGKSDESDDQSEEEEEEEEEDPDSFIVEDSGTAAVELPTEFSMNTFQDLMHHFKIICQLFVHLAVQDLEDRQSFMEQSVKDKYFSVPLQIARRKLEGMRDSSVTSSVWRPSFKKALTKFPEIDTAQMEFAHPGCDACHISSRYSTVIARVHGEPYDRLTFEPLTADESEEDSDEEEVLKKDFDLGRFCARRTRIFHQLTHWEYALFQTLAREVGDLKSRDEMRRVFVPVAYAGAKPPDDLTDADAIMTWLDERGVISGEWHKIKEMMDNAVNLEAASKRGEDVDND